MRLCMQLFGAVLMLTVAALAFGNWKHSPLHRHICGPDTPCPYNMRWLVNGPQTIDNWAAKLCGCTPPHGYAEHLQRVGFHLVNGQFRFLGSDANAGAIMLDPDWETRRAIDWIPRK